MTANPLEKQLIELKDMLAVMTKSMASLQASLDAANAREEEHLRKEKLLQEQVAYLTNKLYGSSSEKHKAPIDGQLSIFDELETEAATLDSGDCDVPADEEYETVSFTFLLRNVL